MANAEEEVFWDFDTKLEEAPTCRVIMFQGQAQSGKTTTVAKLCKRIVFISTDGNAKKQGHRALDFVLLPPTSSEESPAEQVWRSLARLLGYLYKNRDKFDAIAFDLIEYYDNLLQSKYSGVDEGLVGRIRIQDWGDIRTVYQNLNYYLDKYFGDKVIFFLSRQVEEEVPDKTSKNSMAKKTIIAPAIRKKLSNLIDSSVSLNLTIDRDHTLEFYDDYRYEGTPTNPIEAEVLSKILAIMTEQGTIKK